MAMSAEYFQPFSGNGDVSIWVNNSRVDKKTQRNNRTFYWMLKNKSQISKVGFVGKPISIKMRREKKLQGFITSCYNAKNV